MQANQAQFEKELQKYYGYTLTEEFRKDLEENFYYAIEDFYETYKNDPQELWKNEWSDLGIVISVTK